MRYRFLSFLILTVFVQSCSSDRLDVDVSDVELELKLERFDKRMFEVKSLEEMKSVNEELIESGGELYEFYVAEMLRSGSVYDDSIANYLFYFVSDSMMQMTYQDIQTEFGSFKDEHESVVKMFKRLKYHIPKAQMPRQLITYNSAFNYGVTSTNDRIGVGLEMYLGPLNRIVKELGFPLYIKEKMTAEYLQVDIAHSWIMTNVLGENPGETFLDQMIYYGKLRYLIDAMIPDEDDHLKMRYTSDEYEWALASEDDIWRFLMDMNWIYSTEMKVQLRYFDEAPTTVGLEGSPGRIGQFMGWQMVKQYMDKNEDITVLQMINEENHAKFLKTYKPEDE